MEAYVSTFKQCETTDLIHSGLPRSQAGLQALMERTKHVTSYHNIHAYVQNQIYPLLHLLNTTSCHHCTYTQEISISSTLHHATTAHTCIHCPLLHLLNTTSYHHCTYTLSPPPSPQHYIIPPLHIYTVPSSISSTLHHTTTAHIHCPLVLSSVPVNFTRCLWTISSECEGLAGGGGEEAAYMWARENTQATMTWEKRYPHNNTCIQEHTCISTAVLHVLAQPLYMY